MNPISMVKVSERLGLQRMQQLFPGIAVCLVMGMAATFLSEHYGGPTILNALLLGMAFNYLSIDPRCGAGIQFSAKTVLRLGIALLGARITFDQILSLGATPIAIVLVTVPAIIILGCLLGRWLKLGHTQSLLSGCSVAICGASAALAVAAALPQDKEAEQSLIFTVISVTALSTLAMITYPLILSVFNLGEVASGVFLGATIHDVAQVVGAGYLMSDQVGDIATFTKLLRVSMLVPVVLIISLMGARKSASDPGKTARSLPLPGFLLAFILIVSVNSGGFIGSELSTLMIELSRGCLIVAMVGLGMRSSFKEVAAMGWRPMVLMLVETLLLAALVLVALLLSPLGS